MNRQTVLITGATGLVGSLLYEKYISENIKVIVLEHNIKLSRVGSCNNRTDIYRGDISKPRLGLNAEDYSQITSEVTHIWHCAAKTKFSISPHEGKRVNIQGTENVLKFALNCKNLCQVGILSTLYVSGKSTGAIKEEIRVHVNGFVNEYERSKYEMELMVNEYMEKLPIVLYRIGTVVGNSATGTVKQINTIHQALRLLYGGLIPMIPSVHGSKINLISDNYLTEALHYLFENKFKAKGVYHLAGDEREMPFVEEFLESTAQEFTICRPEWQKKNIEIPPIVTLETFNMLRDTIEKTNNSVLQHITEMMNYFVPQLCYPKNFDTIKTQKALEGSGVAEIPLVEYYPKIIRYCINQW